MQSAASVVAGGIFKHFALAGRANVGTGAVFGALVAVALSVSLGPSAFAQSKAAQTAAGAMIIQNNQMRQELRETRKELKEIKDGLGIGAATNEDAGSTGLTPESREALTRMAVPLSSLFLLLLLLPLVLVCRKRFEYAVAGNAEWAGKFAMLYAFVVGTAVLVTGSLVSLAFVSPIGLILLLAIPAWGVFAFLRMHHWGNQLVLQYQSATGDLAVTPEGEDLSDWPTPGVLMGRGIIPILRPAQSGDQRIGKVLPLCRSPLDEVSLQLKPAPRPSAPLWVKTPDGKRGGPFTQDQIAKAITAGKIPDGSEAAVTPDGPWKKIVAKRS